MISLRKTPTAVLFLGVWVVFGAVAIIAATPKAFAFSGSGSGTSGNPYMVTTCSQLEEIQSDPGGYYQLANTIDCGPYGSFTPIPGVFTGTLDGDGHTIQNMNIAVSDSAMFTETSAATFKDLGFTNETVTGNLHAAGISVNDDGGSIFQRVWITSSTIGSANEAGGFISNENGISIATTTITDSFVNGTVHGWNGVGGFIGNTISSNNNILIERSYFVGPTNGSAGAIGGFVGYFDSSLSNTLTISDSFAYPQGPGSPNGIVGYMPQSSGLTFSNVLYDAGGNSTGTEPCAPYAVSGCTAINTATSPNTTYFLNTTAVNPFLAWDFTNTWARTANYPVLESIIGVTTSTFSDFQPIQEGGSVTGGYFTIRNTGTPSSTLYWSATSTMPWLTFNAATGTVAAGTSSVLSATVNASSLSVGTYNATATFSSADGATGPIQIPVMVTVNQSVLSVTTSTSLSFTATAGDTATSSQTITIGNVGPSSTGLVFLTDPAGAAWLSFSPDSLAIHGTTSTHVLVIADPSGLSAGTYQTTATIRASYASGTPVSLPITFTIAGRIPTPVVEVGGGYVQEWNTPLASSSNPPSVPSIPTSTNTGSTPVISTSTNCVSDSLMAALTFPHTLAPGATSPDILTLQRALNYLGFVIAPTGAGSPGNETEYYGVRTEAAVKAFQAAQGIVSSGTPTTNGYGLAGPRTRAALEAALNVCK